MVRFFTAIRPILIIALLSSAALFAPARNISPRQNGESGNTGEGGTSVDSVIDNTTPQLNSSEALQPSLLAEIFGSGAVDPFFKLPGAAANDKSQIANGAGATTEATTAEPTTEPARSIYRYLAASSEIGFKADQSRLSLALASAEAGEIEGLDRLIAEREAQFTAFKALLPPPEAAEIHASSVDVLARYVELMKEARRNAPGGVQEAWDGKERKAIGQKAAELVQQLRDLVHTYNIVPPDGVLP